MNFLKNIRQSLGLETEVEKAAEESIFNPMNVKIGRPLSFDILGFRNLNIFVVALHEHQSGLGTFIDYDLESSDAVETKSLGKLRLFNTNAGRKALLLEQYDKLAYNEGLHDALKKTRESLKVDDDKADLHEEYWRPRDSQLQYPTNVTTLIDHDADGTISIDSEVTKSKLTTWNYTRDAVVEGKNVTQYLFVEMDEKTKGFTLYRGLEINPMLVHA